MKKIFDVCFFLMSLVLIVTGCGGGNNDNGGNPPSSPYTYKVSGVVRDLNGAPLSDVNIHFAVTGIEPTTTLADGTWSKSGLTGTVGIYASKDGYNFDPTTTEVSDANNSVDFIGTPVNISIPKGLRGVTGGSSGDVYIDLTWDHNTEANLYQYNLWYKTPFMTNMQLLTHVPAGINYYRHSNLSNGMMVNYCISAENTTLLGLHNESAKSAPIEVISGDILAPEVPTWASIDPISSDVIGSGTYGADTCWIKLKWNSVTNNDDGSPISDLDHYRVYSTKSNPRVILTAIPYGDPTEWTGNSYMKGAQYKFVITAVDKWGNESSSSTEQSIIAGQ